ncbi:Fructose-1,6-bisphosphatase/inositol-1-monophosphatase [uncultured archaeon]|nr:Fructose-1,6-bisphosphatase/inositol-1-monophosphatase [uncultured archaeon]
MKSQELLLAENACVAAGKIAMGHFREALEIKFKDAGSLRNMVTRADVECERKIKEVISKEFPAHSFLGEEEGRHGNSDFVWVIDPIDGTTNFVHGLDYFAQSVALVHKGVPVCGAVYNPARKMMFSAEKGKGAFLNKKKISVSKVDSIEKSLLLSGFPYEGGVFEEKTLKSMASLRGKCQDLRRFGSASLDFCAVAEGICDAYFEYVLQPWDVAAGMLIAAEAGGKVTDINGGEELIGSKHFLVSNGLIHGVVLEKLERV